jgi:hypothetical protein
MTIGAFRCPRGKYVGQLGMLSAWLPQMVAWANSQGLNTALEALCRYCDVKAAEEYRHAAHDIGENHSELFARNSVANAERWIARKGILLNAKEGIRKI